MINSIQVSRTNVGISTFTRGRAESDQTGLSCALEILGDWQLVCIIPVSKCRYLTTPFIVVLIHCFVCGLCCCEHWFWQKMPINKGGIFLNRKVGRKVEEIKGEEGERSKKVKEGSGSGVIPERGLRLREDINSGQS